MPVLLDETIGSIFTVYGALPLSHSLLQLALWLGPHLVTTNRICVPNGVLYWYVPSGTFTYASVIIFLDLSFFGHVKLLGFSLLSLHIFICSHFFQTDHDVFAFGLRSHVHRNAFVEVFGVGIRTLRIFFSLFSLGSVGGHPLLGEGSLMRRLLIAEATLHDLLG